MKTLLSIFVVIAVFAFAGCAPGQMPPVTSHGVSLTITAPADGSCAAGKPACTYAIYRAAAANGLCPAAGSTAFVAVVPSQSALTFADNSVAGQVVCYGAETLQSGGNSAPSNIVGPFTVPASPTAPGVAGQSAALDAPKLAPMPEQTVATNDMPVLTAIVK